MATPLAAVAKNQRTCVATRVSAPKHTLLRFVAGPDGQVWFDVSGKAPGRGAYVAPTAEALAQAIHKKSLQRHLKVPQPNNLFHSVQQAIQQKSLQLLGLHKKANRLVTGVDKIGEMLQKQPVDAILVAADCGADTKNKASIWQKHNICVLSPLTKNDISGALGVENCAVVAIKATNTPNDSLTHWLRCLHTFTQPVPQQTNHNARATTQNKG